MSGIEAPKGYLLEANYFRLAYQLAAQRVNHMEAGGARGRRLQRAIADADRLCGEVEQALDYLRRLSNAAASPLQRTPTSKERRLQLLLMRTVRPSAQLVLAHLEIMDERLEVADARVERLFKLAGSAIVDWTGPLRYSNVTVVPWSYRSYYNLCCYATARDRVRPEAWMKSSADLLKASGYDPARGNDRPVSVTLWALTQALRRAGDRERRELVRWADQDPALESLRKGEATAREFSELLGRHRPIEAEEPVYEIEWQRSATDRHPLESIALEHAMSDRPGYESHFHPTVVAHAPSQRIVLDGLLKADEGAPDVLIQVLVRTDRPLSPGLSASVERALGRVARYRRLTGRAAHVWVIVILDRSAAERTALTESLKAILGDDGTVAVLDSSELAALRILPVPGSTS